MLLSEFGVELVFAFVENITPGECWGEGVAPAKASAHTQDDEAGAHREARSHPLIRHETREQFRGVRTGSDFEDGSARRSER